MTHHPVTWPIWLVKDLGGLLYSSAVEGVDAKDRARFWRAYARPHGKGWLARLLAWWVRIKGERYRRHNEKKRISSLRQAA